MTVGTEAVIDAKRSIGHNGLGPVMRRCGTQILTLHASARPT
tara:strand:- start:385 stop:510 length:126 start_codon:yes stop_codon:yes gene_type:complete